ncbi:MAG: Gfo/Idh/MocA family oxidoreductase [Candidatus Sumerlaeota bacterium]|nr:Gfo/Idh/MocA family oxidoreductase [Candidatus Sumerlaeota bacterium]
MSDQARIALIGCGGIARRHVQDLLKRSDCRITALCDAAPERAQEKLAQIQKTRPGESPAILTDYKEVLKRDDVDGVAVLLPHSLHHPVAKAALQAGKHVLVEKPMTTSVDEARDLIETARRAGRKLGIAYQRAFLSEYLYSQRAVANGELGQVRFMTAHLEQAWFQGVTNPKKPRGWKTDPAQAGGGQLVDSGSHTLAALLQVCPMDPDEVFAIVDNCGLPVDVNTSMVVKFAQGPQAAITIGGFGHSVTESIRIVGDKASLKIFFRTVAEQALEVNGAPVDAKSLIPPSTPDENFVDVILGRAEFGADALLGLRVAQLSEAAYQSAREDRPVKVKR